MIQIGLFYGSTTGNTEEAAIAIAKAFRNFPEVAVDLFEISTRNVGKLNHYRQIIIGAPTWDIGELQEDWKAVSHMLEQMSFHGKQIALFGYGDQYGYPDTYQDAVGILARLCAQQGAEIVGWWPTAGYSFKESLAVEGEMFLGLALDDNQRKQTELRIQQWARQLIHEFSPALAAVA